MHSDNSIDPNNNSNDINNSSNTDNNICDSNTEPKNESEPMVDVALLMLLLSQPIADFVTAKSSSIISTDTVTDINTDTTTSDISTTTASSPTSPTSTIKSATRDYNPLLRIEAASATSQGCRKAMEDQHVSLLFVNELLGIRNCPPQAYFGVYDGHSGKVAAEYTRTHLHHNIIKDDLFHTDILTTFKRAYRKTDTNFHEVAHRECITSGTTVVSLLVREDAFYLANVGDTEAVLSRNGQAVVLSVPHAPGKEDEKQRIVAAGGTVVWYGTWRVNGLLSVSRSIGDVELHGIVIPDPYVTKLQRTDADEFIVMATDGLWDVIKHQEAVDIVNQQLNLGSSSKKDIAQFLLDEAGRRKSADNVTVVLVFFDKMQQPSVNN